MSALDLFRMGFNTIEIAAALGKAEFEIERLIHAERTEQINDYKHLRQARR